MDSILPLVRIPCKHSTRSFTFGDVTLVVLNMPVLCPFGFVGSFLTLRLPGKRCTRYHEMYVLNCFEYVHFLVVFLWLMEDLRVVPYMCIVWTTNPEETDIFSFVFKSVRTCGLRQARQTDSLNLCSPLYPKWEEVSRDQILVVVAVVLMTDTGSYSALV
jgi:hypothetical protein